MIKHFIFFIICLAMVLYGGKSVHALDTTINGFISQGYLKTDKNNWLADTEEGSFQFNDLALRFSSRLTSRLFLGIQFYARDLGDLGNCFVSSIRLAPTQVNTRRETAEM